MKAILFGLIFLDFIAIVAVLNVNIEYSTKERILKLLFIIMIPIIGAIMELRKLDKISRYIKNDNGEYIKKASFFTYYTSSDFAAAYFGRTGKGSNIDNSSGIDGGSID